jgi:3-oxoacyl-ACP reductase-like protein
MDELNKMQNVPTSDALVKEEHIVEVKPVEPVVAQSPAPAAPTPAAPAAAAPAPAAAAPAPKPVKEDKNLVALYSAKDFVSISKGYSKVDKAIAEELLKNKNVRLATQEEISQNLNK